MITVYTPIIVAVVPIVVWGIKKIVPTKDVKWALPLFATVLGGVADAIVSWETGQPLSPVTAAITGLATVGLREVVDQLKKETTGQTK